MQRWLWFSRTANRWAYAKVDHEYVLYGSATLESPTFHPNETFRLLAGGSGSHPWYREGFGPDYTRALRRFVANKDSSGQWERT